MILSFLAFLLESLRIDKEKFHNPSVNQLKSLSQRFKRVRYAISKDGDVRAGNPYHFTHYDLADGDPSNENDIEGYIEHNGKDFTFSAHDTYGNYYNKHGKDATEHPIVRKLMSRGIRLDNDALHDD